MELWSISRYARALKPALPKQAFEPARTRVLWLPLHLSVIAACSYAIASGWVTGWARLLLVPVLGFSFAGITFLAHEALHGAVLRGRLARWLVGFIGFLPFLVSPKLWVRWHNQVHHGNAQSPERDPDAFPTLERYHTNNSERWVIDRFSVGRRRIWGLLTLLLGFSFHSKHILLNARSNGLMSAAEHATAWRETVLALALWAGVLWWVGPGAFLFIYLLPLMVANAIVMAYILTNHSLSPLTQVNDPLINSLSVTVPRFVDWLTLHFGYHVEHHVFPWMSTRHARKVRELIVQRWPERYQSLPLHRALWHLHRTARVYKDEQTLIDPRSGKQWHTLSPGENSTRDPSPLPSLTPPAPSSIHPAVPLG